jgi:hypothetical protein
MPNRFTISGSSFGSASWNDPSIWSEGIVPTSSDNIYIRGVRTTINYNINDPQGASYYPWVGSISMVVGSTAGFPPSGSFYTYSDRDDEIKINYGNITNATTFGSCSIDTSFNSWSLATYPVTESLPSRKGGFIANGSYIQFRPGIIDMKGIEVSASYIEVYNGGHLRISSGSTLNLFNRVVVGDATLEVTGSNTIRWDRDFRTQVSNANDDQLCWIYSDALPFSKLLFNGPEVRTNTTLTATASIGDSFLTVSDTSNFRALDWIFVGVENLTASRTDNGREPQGFVSTTNMDEGFKVVHVSGSNQLYIARHAALEGRVIATGSSTELFVDEERYAVGDKVIINGQVRTVTSVTSSYDYLLKDYDFTGINGSSSFTEWETDITRSVYFSDWQLINGLGLTQHVSNLYRHTFQKNIMLDKIKVEAYVSNLRGNTFGTGSRSEFGVYIHADPTADFDMENPRQTNQPYRTSFSIDPSQGRIFMRQRNYNNGYYINNFTGSGATNGLGLSADGPKKITLESERGFIRGYFQDELIFEEIAKGGAMWGRAGLYTYGNSCFTCTRYVIYQKCQKITLSSAVTGVTAGNILYETGVEYRHNVGEQVIKLSSVVTDIADQENLIFAYRGASEYKNNGAFPYVKAVNLLSGTNTSWQNFYKLVNRDNYDLAENYGNGQQRSTIVDFTTASTFNSIGLVEWAQYSSYGQNFNQSNGLTFSGSNDNVNWIPITGTVDARYRVTPEHQRFINLTSSVTYRFVRIETNGYSNSPNGYNNYNYVKSLFVRNLVNTGSSTIYVNNVSDFSVGDEVVIIPRSSEGNFRPIFMWYDRFHTLAAGNTPTSSFLDNFKQHYTITAVSSSTGYGSITLDRLYNDGYLYKDDYVVKVNRGLKISGSFAASGSGKWATGRITAFPGANPVRRISFKNVSFQHINGRYTTRGDGYRDGFSLNEYNWFDYVAPLQGCSFYNCFSDYNPWYWINRDGFSVRHNFISSFSDVRIWGYNTNTTTLPIVVTGNIFNQMGMGAPRMNRGQMIFSWNHSLAVNSPFQQQQNSFNSTDSPVYITSYFVERNIGRSNDYGVIFGYNNNAAQNGRDNIGAPNMTYKVRNNKLEYCRNSATIIYQPGEKGFETPVITGNRGGWDQNSYIYPYNGTNELSQTEFANSGRDHYMPGHYPIQHASNHNRWGYSLWINNRGYWIKNPNENYYRYYRTFYLSNSNPDWRDPIMAAYFYIGDDNISASFDLDFDYFINKGLVISNQGNFSGSLAVYALKNGKELRPTVALPKSTISQHYRETISVSGSGYYYIALGGLENKGGYAGISNIESKFNVPESDDVTLFSNTFTTKYFGSNKKVYYKTNFTVSPTDNKFRLKGARLF